GELDLPRRGPCPGVVAVRPGFRSHRRLLRYYPDFPSELAAPSDVRNPGGLVDTIRPADRQQPVWALNLGCGLLLAASRPGSAAPRRPGGGYVAGVDDVNRLVLSVLTMLVLFSLAAWTT